MPGQEEPLHFGVGAPPPGAAPRARQPPLPRCSPAEETPPRSLLGAWAMVRMGRRVVRSEICVVFGTIFSGVQCTTHPGSKYHSVQSTGFV